MAEPTEMQIFVLECVPGTPKADVLKAVGKLLAKGPRPVLDLGVMSVRFAPAENYMNRKGEARTSPARRFIAATDRIGKFFSAQACVERDGVEVGFCIREIVARPGGTGSKVDGVTDAAGF